MVIVETGPKASDLTLCEACGLAEEMHSHNELEECRNRLAESYWNRLTRQERRELLSYLGVAKGLAVKPWEDIPSVPRRKIKPMVLWFNLRQKK